MIKELSQVAKIFIKLYWKQTLLWVVFQFLIIAIYRKLTIVTTIGEPIPQSPSNAVIFILEGAIALSFMALLIFLGNTFSSSQRANWIRLLPFTSRSLNLFPLIIVLSYGLALLFFIPWGAFSSGVSVFTIGIPVAIFLYLKNAKNYIVGLLKSAALGVGLIAMWMYLFYDWSHLQPGLYVEMLALILFSGLWLLLGKSERKYALYISGVLLVLLGTTTVYRQTRTPQNLIQATLDHAFFPTEKTWDWFKKIALEKPYWESVDQFKLSSYVRYRAQDFSDVFSDQEKIQFIENIQFNLLKWKDAKLPEHRPMRFASFLQPEIRFRNYSSYPIGRNNISPTVTEYLYNNWQDSRLFCQLLPFEKSARYIDKLFRIEDCSYELFNQAPWTFYSLNEYGDYERQFDKFLLEAFEKSPSKTRSSLMSYMISGWNLYEIKDKYDDYRSVIFSQKPISPELLEEAKKDRYRESLKKMKELASLDQKEFLNQVKDFDPDDKEAKVPVLFLCQYLNDDCNTYLNKRKSETLLESWGRRLHDLTFTETGLWVVWMKEEIAKKENWAKIEELRKYVASRTDL